MFAHPHSQGSCPPTNQRIISSSLVMCIELVSIYFWIAFLLNSKSQPETRENTTINNSEDFLFIVFILFVAETDMSEHSTRYFISTWDMWYGEILSLDDEQWSRSLVNLNRDHYFERDRKCNTFILKFKIIISEISEYRCRESNTWIIYWRSKRGVGKSFDNNWFLFVWSVVSRGWFIIFPSWIKSHRSSSSS